MKLSYLLLAIGIIMVAYGVAYFRLSSRLDVIGLDGGITIVRSFDSQWTAIAFYPAGAIESFVSHSCVERKFRK